VEISPPRNIPAGLSVFKIIPESMIQTTAPNPTAGDPAYVIEPSVVEDCRKIYASVQHELAKVIVGQNDVIEQILISILTKSHALLVGVPGLAKTLIISTLADTLHLTFRRIQFTPDPGSDGSTP
jgi:MoxR-like ATPase